MRTMLEESYKVSRKSMLKGEVRKMFKSQQTSGWDCLSNPRSEVELVTG